MTAYGGNVKAELDLGTTKFSAAWKKVLAELNNSPTPTGPKKIQEEFDKIGPAAGKNGSQAVDAFKKMGSAYDSVVRKMQNSTNASVRQIGNTLSAISSKFNVNNISNKFEAVMRKMPSLAQSAASKITSALTTIASKVNFNSLSNKFNATIRHMASSAQSGVRNITSSFSSMESGLAGILGTVTAGLGMSTLFEIGQAKAVTQQMLTNMNRGNFFEGYEKYTMTSATSDVDINRMFQWVAQTPGLESKDVYRALSAIDAASYSTDSINRLRDQLAWSKYIQGGWNTAASAMRDEPLPDFIKQKMQAAKTVEERIAVAEEFARLRGTVDAFGYNLSTTTTGAVGDFNAALVAVDNLTRALRDAFTALLHALRPVIDWFNNLGEPLQGLIGKFILAGTVLVGLIGGLKLFASALSPVTGILKGLGGGASDLIPGINIGGKAGGLPFLATTPGQFLTGLSGIPALAGKSGGTWAGMTGATRAGTVTFGAILGALYGHLMNMADTSQKDNPIWGATRMVTPLTFVGAPFQAGMGLLGDIFSGKALEDPLGTAKDYGQGMLLPKTLQENVLIKPAFDAMNSAVENVTNAFRDAWNSINTFFGGIWNDLTSAVGTVSSAFRDVWSALSPAVNELSSAFGEVQSALGSVYNELSGAFGDVWNELSGAASEVYSALNSLWSEAIQPVSDAFSELWTALFPVTEATGDVAPAIQEAKPAFNLIKDGAKWLADGIRSVTPYIITFAGYIRTAADWVKQFAEFIHKVSETIHNFRSTLSNFKLPTWADVVGWVEDKLNIKGSLNLSDWFNNGVKWIRDKLNKIKGSLNLSDWFNKGVKWIRDKLNQLRGSFNISSLASNALDWIRKKINQLRGSFNISGLASSAVSWVYTRVSKIFGSFNISALASQAWSWVKNKLNFSGAMSGITRGISSFASWVKGSGGPAGPKSTTQNSFIDHASGSSPSSFLDMMFSNFRYEPYEGSRKTIAQTLEDMSGNCVDGSFAQVWMAGQLGVPAGLDFTTWNGSPHVLSVIENRPRDVANRAITGSWDRPPAGPGHSGPNGGVFIAKGAVQIQGDINGIKDAEKTMEKVFVRMANKYLV